MRLRTLLPAPLLGVLAFFFYRFTAATDILPGDPGEFQFTLPLAGVSHPTGYPLYHILGWYWERFFSTNPAQGANYFSALWGGVAVSLFYLLCYKVLQGIGERPRWRGATVWLATLTTLLFAMNPTFRSQAVIAEVYTLHAALVAALLLASVVHGEGGSGGMAWLPALVLGLGLTHHLTIVLMLPAVLLYLAWTQPESLTPGKLLRTLPFLLLPLLLYLYIPLRAPASPWLTLRLTTTRALSLFDDSVLGNLRFMLGTGFASALHTPGEALRQIPASLALFVQHFSWPGILLILLGITALILEGRLEMLALTGIGFLVLVVFNLFYGIGDIYTFYIPPYLIATVWLGAGMAYGVELLTRMVGVRLRLLYLLAAAGILAVPYFQIMQTDILAAPRLAIATRERWQALLTRAGLPENAILVSNDRDEMTPFYYMQQIEGLAPQMTGLFPLISPDPAWADLNTTLATALATGRPVYTIKPMPGLETLYLLEPDAEGTVRVLGPQPAPNPSFEQPYGDHLRWLGIEWRGDTSPGGQITVTLYWRVTQSPPRIWHSFLQIYNAQGEKVKQANDHRPGGDYVPSPLWRAGDVVVDHFVLTLPEELPPGDYTLVAGFYDPVSGRRYADPLTVASLVSPAYYE